MTGTGGNILWIKDMNVRHGIFLGGGCCNSTLRKDQGGQNRRNSHQKKDNRTKSQPCRRPPSFGDFVVSFHIRTCRINFKDACIRNLGQAALTCVNAMFELACKSQHQMLRTGG
jgi:hypothetical protein